MSVACRGLQPTGRHAEGSRRRLNRQAGKRNNEVPAADVPEAFAKMPAADRELAMAQKTCPVSNEPLGSMGEPVKVVLDGQPVFLCCKGCQSDAEKDPAGVLAKIKQMRPAGPGQVVAESREK